MQPGQQNNFVSRCDALQSIWNLGNHIEPRVRRAFRALPRRLARRFKTERIDPIGLTRISWELVLLFVVDFTTANRIDVEAENDQVVARINLAGKPDDRWFAKSCLIRSDTLKKFHSQARTPVLLATQYKLHSR